MAMTVADIIAEARGIIQEVDPANSHVSDAQFITWINACTLQLCSVTASLPKANITGMVTAADLVFDTSLLRLDYASYTDPTGQKIPLKTVDFVNFVYENPDWENRDADRPRLLVRKDDTNWFMFPTPSATYTGLAMTIMGAVLPAPVTTTSENPPLNQVWHPVYPHYLAWKAFLVINDPARAQAEFNQYDMLRKLNLKTATSTSGSRQFFRMSM